MSTGGNNANQAAETVKMEVRQTIQQLNELTRSDANFDEFCQTVLAKVVKLTGAHGALLWQVNGKGVPAVTHKAAGHNAENISPNAQQHANVVREVMGKEELIGLMSTDLPAVVDENGEPVEQPDSPVYLMLFSPVYNRRKKCCGSIELLQRSDISTSAQEGYLKFLAQISQLFPRWHEQHDLSKLSQSADRFSEKMDFITEIHGSIQFHETAHTVANESRRLLNCDRVSVGTWNGSRCKIIAISSQDRFDNRANVVRLLSNVATSSVSADTAFWVTGNTEDLAPEVATQINEYLDESHCRTLAVIPLISRPDDTADLEMDKRLKEQPKKLGVIVFEFFDRDVGEDEINEDTKLVVEQATLAVRNARQHSEIFLYPVWQRLGWIQQLLFRDHFAKTVTALSCLAILMGFLLFYPAELKMKVDGVLHPEIQQNIFSMTEGHIDKVHIQDQANVVKDQKLLVLENKGLAIEIGDVESMLTTVQRQIQTMQFQKARDENKLSNEQIGDLDARIQKLIDEKHGLDEKLRRLHEKRDELTILSPIEGRIVTWEVNQRLKGLPVTANQPILAVADFDGPWQLEVKIPQGDIGYVQSALTANNDEPIDVDFVVGTNPNLTLHGKLIRISDRAEMSESGAAEFRAVVEADVEELRKNGGKELRQGAGVTARIKCGRKSLGFVWFYQVYDFFRTTVFF